MSLLKSFSINTTKNAPFPFNIPAVKFAREIDLGSPVVIFAGDNGCGKSTLLESLALKVNLPLIGGYIASHHGFDAARLIKPFLDLGWRRQIEKGFFFRAEDFSDFINSIERENQKLQAQLQELKGQVDDSIIRQMSDSMNYTLHRTRKDYGDDMQAYSHGEAYLKILQTRIGNRGLFLLDEPEAALSPLKQLSLMAMILEIIKGGLAQFILATHSPILMGIPGALLYQITDTEMEKVAFTETDHYRVTKTFLDNPDAYLRHF